MLILIAFAFLAGVVTVLSPCILPILPIILSSAVGERIDKLRPIGVVVGFVMSFTFFTLFLSLIVRETGISADSLRLFSVVVIAGFGISLFVPKFQLLTEQLFSKLAGFIPNAANKSGLLGGLIIGLSVGLLWTPCVGPILASVISLAITGTVTFDAFVITLAYSLGTAIPMFLIMVGGQGVLRKVPGLMANLGKIQKGFGVVMLLTAVGIYFQFDRKFQIFILEKFPQYGVGLTKFEDNDLIRQQLNGMNDQKNLNYKKAPELVGNQEWFNSESLQLAQLRGKVVLVDFWTYTCINCIRNLPYVQRWYEKYKDKGLVVIGVHSPEFEFEKNPQNVKRAIMEYNLTYPVVQDNDFKTWQAYDNLYWPAKYFVDKNGFIRYTHFGEGDYDESEAMLVKLLEELGSEVGESINNPSYEITSRTPETYLGYKRMERLGSVEEVVLDGVGKYSVPKSLGRNSFAFEGEWFVSSEYSSPRKGSGLEMDFESKQVFLVMNSNGAGSIVRVILDGKLVQELLVKEDKLYKLVELENAGRHRLRLEFGDDGAKIFAFTFG